MDENPYRSPEEISGETPVAKVDLPALIVRWVIYAFVIVVSVPMLLLLIRNIVAYLDRPRHP